MPGVFPILFVTSHGLSEVVFESGLLGRLAEEIPHAAFTVVTSPKAAELFRDTPRLERVIPLERESGGTFGLWRKLSGRAWGLVLDARDTGVAKWLRAKKRAAPKPWPPDQPIPHRVVEAARLLRLEDEPPAPGFFVSDETQAAADALLKGEGPILAVGPGAGWVGRAWPEERFNHVAARLLGPDGPMAGGRLLILGAESERDAARTIRYAASGDRVIDLTGKTDLLTAYACLRRARLFLGPDAAITHLAAAAGAPVVGVYGPSDEHRRGPWAAHAVAVRGPRSFEDFRALDPALDQAIIHMSDLPAETVHAAAVRLFEDTEADFA